MVPTETLTNLLAFTAWITKGSSKKLKLDACLKNDSNTDHLHSQWLNSVIYWLTIHCMD